MSRQSHFSTMVAANVPCLPWRHPAYVEHTTTNQDYCLPFSPVEDRVGRNGMPLVRYRRTPWFGVSDASFVHKLLEVVSTLWTKRFHLVQKLHRNKLIRKQFIPPVACGIVWGWTPPQKRLVIVLYILLKRNCPLLNRISILGSKYLIKILI